MARSSAYCGYCRDVGFGGFAGFVVKKIVRQIQGLEPSRCHAVNPALACTLRLAIHRNMCHQWIQEPMRCLMNQQLTCAALGNGTIPANNWARVCMCVDAYVRTCGRVCACARGGATGGLFDVAVSYFCSKLFPQSPPSPQVSPVPSRSPMLPHTSNDVHTGHYL
jgi:hypothetical protein